MRRYLARQVYWYIRSSPSLALINHEAPFATTIFTTLFTVPDQRQLNTPNTP
ncbi:hypothetical protein PGTUg99_014362 [Puccinia graminis f. sp. tritici]|uniref:Uncharacterized protein n=1 Tax=Puccinia graminis f. sp. tritici TaxID=56615 RepID=A0A5B0NRF3_PUCGR|nr:hypothetical protein PGTUg99_014362 [Puccinia graminis f. sp. tritici]